MSSIVLSWWSRCGGALLRQSYCRGGGWVFVVVIRLSLWSRGVGLSWWWWGFAVLSGIQIRGRCRFVFAGHRCRLEKLVRGDGRIDDENEPQLPSWFVFMTYCVGLPLPGSPLLFLQPTLEVPSPFSSSFPSVSCSSSYRCITLIVVVDLPMLALRL